MAPNVAWPAGPNVARSVGGPKVGWSEGGPKGGWSEGGLKGGWSVGVRTEGRKTWTASGMYDDRGRLVARAQHLWIAFA